MSTDPAEAGGRKGTGQIGRRSLEGDQKAKKKR